MKRGKSLKELEEKYFGKKGTKSRDEYDAHVRIEIIGELLRQMREENNMTQSQLAKKLGIDKAYVSKMENNLKTQRLDTIVKVLKALKANLFIRLPKAGGAREFELI